MGKLKDFLRNTWAFIYGDRKLLTDFILSLLMVSVFFYFQIKLDFIGALVKTLNESTISFLGILVGFLLTAFSLLLTFDPKRGSILAKMRDHRSYKDVLHTFLSAAVIAILTSVLLIFSNSLYAELSRPELLHYTILFLFTLTMFRVIKCIYYLRSIVNLV